MLPLLFTKVLAVPILSILTSLVNKVSAAAWPVKAAVSLFPKPANKRPLFAIVPPCKLISPRAATLPPASIWIAFPPRDSVLPLLSVNVDKSNDLSVITAVFLV